MRKSADLELGQEVLRELRGEYRRQLQSEICHGANHRFEQALPARAQAVEARLDRLVTRGPR